jgi:sialate O-acetylesterase
MRRAALILLTGAACLLAEVKPSALFSDHMVLQSGMAVPVWGTPGAGERVTVTLNGQTQSATAAADGKWMVRLKNLKAGGPFQMPAAPFRTDRWNYDYGPNTPPAG